MVASSIAAAIEALLAATPEPPPLETDPRDVLVSAQEMLAIRSPLCHALSQLAAAQAVPVSHARPYRMLLDRDARWAASLGRARRALAERLDAVRHLRRARP